MYSIIFKNIYVGEHLVPICIYGEWLIICNEINEWTSCVLVRNEFAAIIFRLECTFYETTEATIRHAVGGKSFEYLLCNRSTTCYDVRPRFSEE